MKHGFNPYHLLILVASVAAMAFARINKHDFYHHYFKVIGEVEIRNSQEVLLPTVVKWSSLPATRVLRTAGQWLLAFLAPAFLAYFFFQPLDLAPIWRSSKSPLRPGSRLFLRTHPIHGP